MKDEIPVWTVKTHTTNNGAKRPGDAPVIRIEAHLMAGGRCHHVITGANAVKVMKTYAERLNRQKKPCPPITPKTRADGWSQPKDVRKVSNVIAPEIFNHVVK